MQYCPINSPIYTAWIDSGFNRCFLDTVETTILLAFMLFFGGGQLIIYAKSGWRPQPDQLKPRIGALFVIQIFCHVILTLWPFLIFILIGTGQFKSDITNDSNDIIYGHQVYKYVAQFAVWVAALTLVQLERNYVTKSQMRQGTRGHGPCLMIFWVINFLLEIVCIVSVNSNSWFFQLKSSGDKIQLALYVIEFSMVALLLYLGIKAPGLPTMESIEQMGYESLDGFDGETAVKNPFGHKNAQHPRLTGRRETFNITKAIPDKKMKSGFWKKFRMIMPFLWPQNNWGLQIRVVFCLLTIIAGRVINVYVPIYNKYIVNSLTATANYTQLVFRWDLILIYVAFKLFQGGGFGTGFINTMRTFVWVNVQQFTSRELLTTLYAHLHNLSLRWHLMRKTGEVIRVMDRGNDAMRQLLGFLLFQITPTIADILVAVIYLGTAFNFWFGLIVFITMALYLSFTIGITEWRTKFRRQMNKLDNETKAKGVDSLLNFETVKYYNNEEYEVDRYRSAMLKFQKAEWMTNLTLCILNNAQMLVINAGLLTGSLLCAKMVVDGTDGFTVGDYVLFSSYIVQLYQPLNFFGTSYQMIQQAFIDVENMFDLLKENCEVEDNPDSEELQVDFGGSLEFKNVYFHYVPEKPILTNISFKVDPGRTIALVGPSGGGKSTILRLLFRFYDIQSGIITFNGQDISKVSQTSLRRHIGVVPQDTVLFNENIRYNIRYGRHEATDEEVEAAAHAADIHEKIETFPDKYETMVGERGLKLSGGEKQRVAIARTILKAPTVVLLDEATAALDTQTERNIQASLNKIVVDRTTVIVAHRLSTIIHADEILVLVGGSVIERGRHEELLKLSGVYAKMWQAQLQKAEHQDSGRASPNSTGNGSTDSAKISEVNEEEEEAADEADVEDNGTDKKV